MESSHRFFHVSGSLLSERLHQEPGTHNHVTSVQLNRNSLMPVSLEGWKTETSIHFCLVLQTWIILRISWKTLFKDSDSQGLKQGLEIYIFKMLQEVMISQIWKSLITITFSNSLHYLFHWINCLKPACACTYTPSYQTSKVKSLYFLHY